VGTPLEAHKFTPHVTVARMRHPEPGKVLEWLSYHALYTSVEFEVGAFHLYSSVLTSDGSSYRIERDYELGDL
jgi:2'-5' RNA ligase